MNRQAAVATGAVLAAGAVSGILILTARLHAERNAERERYAEEIIRLRQETVRPTPAAPALPSARPAGGGRRLCVSGVDTFAVAVDRALRISPVSRDGSLELARLVDLSDQAVRAERYAEQGAPPALPQRMGCGRTSSTEGHPRCLEPLQPVRTACDGEAFAEAPLAGAPTELSGAAGPAAKPRGAPKPQPDLQHRPRSRRGSQR
jgi:hypothetical protein